MERTLRAIECEHEVRPKLREAAGLAAVEAKPEEHFQTPPAVPRYPICEWKKLDHLKPRDWHRWIWYYIFLNFEGGESV